jgi:hypothetical protein
MYASYPEMILRDQSRLLIHSLSQAAMQAGMSAPLAAIMKAFASMIVTEKERLEKADQAFLKSITLPGHSKDATSCNVDSG